MCTSYSDPYEYTKIENGKIKYIKKRTRVKGECRHSSNGYIIDKNKNIRDSGNRNYIVACQTCQNKESW